MLHILDTESLGYPVLQIAGLSSPNGGGTSKPGAGANGSASSSAGGDCPSCLQYRTEPQLDGNLQVDPEIVLPSPGMAVDIAYYYNSNATLTSSGSIFGLGRTLSTNLLAQAWGSPLIVTLTRGNGGVATYQHDGSGSYGIADFSSVTQQNANTLQKDIPNNLWLETVPDGTITAYPVDTAGHITSITYAQDAVGNRHTFAYASGLLSTLQDAVGRMVSFSYASGRLDNIQDWAGRRTTFQYDTSIPARPVLTTVTGPSGCQTGYGYDAGARLTSVTDPNGYATTYAYDAANRVTQRTIPGMGMTQYLYTGAATVITKPNSSVVTNSVANNWNVGGVVDATGVQTTVAYSTLGLVTSQQDYYGAVTSYSYDSSNLLKGTTDALGRITTYQRDSFKNVTTTIYADGTTNVALYGYAGSSFDTTGSKHRVQATVDQVGNRTSYAYNGRGQLLSMQDALGNFTTFGYDNFGNQVSVTDPLANVSTRLYDLAGNLTGTIDALGNQSTLTYDPQNRVLASSDPLGNTTSMGYDSVGNLTVQINPLGNRTSFTYNVFGNPLTVQDALGNVTTTNYDSNGWALSTQNALGFLTSTVYDAAGRPLARIDALGYPTSSVYDAAGRAVAMIDALGSRTSTAYDLLGRAQASIDQLGYRNTTVYDILNRPIAHIDALGRTSTTVYDNDGRMQQMIDALGEVSSTVYDALGRSIARVDALGNTTTTVYDNAGRMVASIDALGYRTSYGYDAAGRMVCTQDARGSVSTSVYDGRGMLVANANTRGFRTTTSYDGAGRRTGIAQPYIYPSGYSADPQRTTWVYDAGGRVVVNVDGIGSRLTYTYDALGQQLSVYQSTYYLNITTTNVYDALGRVAARVSNGGNRTTISFDPLGRQSSLQDAVGNITSNLYDARGLLLSAQSAWGAFTTQSYDPVGNVSLRLDGRGWPTSYAYDALDRQVRTQYPDGGLVTRVYDTIGRETALLDPSGATTTTYDALGQALRVAVANPDGTAYSLSYGYDGAGNRLFLADGEGRVTTYSYAPVSDEFNHVNMQTPYQKSPTTLQFDDRGRLFVTYPGINAFAFDERNRHRNDQWEYDAYYTAGSVEKAYYSADVKTSNWVNSQSERNGGSSAPFTTTYYRFDLDEEITYDWRIDNPGYAITYSYDHGGNRLTQNSLGVLTTYSYLVGNRLSSEQTGVALTTYSYDPNGNQTGINAAGSVTTNTYDAENRLTGVQNSDGSVESMLYSVDGPRKQRSVTPSGGSTSTTHFVYDGTNLHQERDNNGLALVQYGWRPEQINVDAGAVWQPGAGGDSLVLQRRASVPGDLADGTTSIFAFDTLGQVRAMLDSNDNITDMWNWNVFGTPFTRTGSTVTPFGFGGLWGYYTDNARRLNVGWRVYDPTTGQWTTTDPIGFDGGDANLYRYVMNNPARFVDPRGLFGTACDPFHYSNCIRHCLPNRPVTCLRLNFILFNITLCPCTSAPCPPCVPPVGTVRGLPLDAKHWHYFSIMLQTPFPTCICHWSEESMVWKTGYWPRNPCGNILEV